MCAAHLVNPTTGQRTKFDAKGEAVCPICGAVWWRYEGFIMLVTGEDRRSKDRLRSARIKRNRLERRDPAALAVRTNRIAVTPATHECLAWLERMRQSPRTCRSVD
jgi:uncharacterized Zn finger protein (UPF0148 family)